MTAARWRIAGLAALIGYGVLIACFYASIPASADAFGYLNNGRLLAEGKLTLTSRTVPELGSYPWHNFVPLGYWSLEGETELRPLYPFGMALHYMLAAKIAGWYWGPLLAGTLCAVAAVGLTYLCARELGISLPLSVASAVALGMSPIFLSASLQPMSDGPSATWSIAALYAALRARRSWPWSITCGAACGMAVLIRAPNILLVPALCIALWNWKNLLGAALGGAAPALALGISQHILYGSALRSGYGNAFALFQTSAFSEVMYHFGKWTLRFTPMTFAVAPLAFALPWRERFRETFALVATLAAFLIFYAFYPEAKTESWWGLRFILPALPAGILLASLALDSFAASRTSGTWQRVAIVATCTVFAVTILSDAYWIQRLRIPKTKRSQQVYVEAPAWAVEHLPSEALVVCMQASGTLYFNTRFPILRWDQMTLADFEKYEAALRKTGRPLYAMLLPWEETEWRKRGFMQGTWETITEIRELRILKLAPSPNEAR